MTRRLPKDGNLKYALSATDAPVDTIRPGEVVDVECEINCNAGVITSTESKLSPESMRFPFVNPATGPFAEVFMGFGSPDRCIRAASCGSRLTCVPCVIQRGGACRPEC